MKLKNDELDAIYNEMGWLLDEKKWDSRDSPTMVEIISAIKALAYHVDELWKRGKE